MFYGCGALIWLSSIGALLELKRILVLSALYEKTSYDFVVVSYN